MAEYTFHDNLFVNIYFVANVDSYVLAVLDLYYSHFSSALKPLTLSLSYVPFSFIRDVCPHYG